MPNNRSLKAAADEGRSLTCSEAAQLTGYSRDHIGLLVRRGTVLGHKFGRDWVVDAKSLFAYVKGSPKPGRKSVD